MDSNESQPPFKMLYIDDEADKVDFIKNMFTPDGINKFVTKSATLDYKVSDLFENISFLNIENKNNVLNALSELTGSKCTLFTFPSTVSEKILLLCPESEFPSDSDKFQLLCRCLSKRWAINIH
jgi:hypothetical protein